MMRWPVGGKKAFWSGTNRPLRTEDETLVFQIGTGIGDCLLPLAQRSRPGLSPPGTEPPRDTGRTPQGGLNHLIFNSY
eukprot:symbB.v1.2.030969.t1/scaffold3541.1/size54392/5